MNCMNVVIKLLKIIKTDYVVTRIFDITTKATHVTSEVKENFFSIWFWYL